MMNVSKDLICIKDAKQCELYIGDWGFLGIQFHILSPGGTFLTTLIHPTDLGQLIETLTRFHQRNKDEGVLQK